MSFIRHAAVTGVIGAALVLAAGQLRAPAEDDRAGDQPIEPGAAVGPWEEASRRASELASRGQFSEAIQAAEQALTEAERVLGPDHPKVAAMLNNLAGIYRVSMVVTTNRYIAAASPLYDRALAICETAFGPEHPTVAAVLTNLSQVYKAEGRYADGEKLAKRALDIWKKMYGPNDPRVAVALNHLADLYKGQGRFKEAEAAYQEAMERFQESLGPGHPMVESSLDDLTKVMEMAEREKNLPDQPEGSLLAMVEPGSADTGDTGSAAEAQFRWKLDAMEATLGPNHPNVATLLNSFGDLYVAHSRFDEALPMYQRALAIDENSFSPVHERVAKDLNRIVALYRAEEKWAEAEPVYARLVSVMEEVLDKEAPDLLKVLDKQAVCLEKLGKTKEAKAVRARLEAAERAVKGR